MTEESTGIALCIRAVAVTVEISAKGRELVKIFCKRVDEELGNLLCILFKNEKVFLLAVEGVIEFKNTVCGSDRYGMLGRGGEVADLIVICADNVNGIFHAFKEKKRALIRNDLYLGFFAHFRNCRNYAVVGYCRKHFLAHSLMLLYQL